MTSHAADAPGPAPGKWRLSGWRIRLIGFAVIAVTLVISYFFLAAFLPRWWAQRIGDQADGSLMKGSWLGIGYGALFTLIPLLLVALGITVFRRMGAATLRIRAIAALLLLLIAAVSAAPNLITLAIVTGDSHAAHAGEQILNVEGPGYRGGTLIGVIVTALVYALTTVGLMAWRRGRHKRKHERELARQAAA